ncbi:hypothetical protein RhiLY_09266 [Ceratobasidium sp. AG-Ba]|nr:hypothetical protein RhiLY_09266 [Ceratobasidium sp. AG-Ba]
MDGYDDDTPAYVPDYDTEFGSDDEFIDTDSSSNVMSTLTSGEVAVFTAGLVWSGVQIAWLDLRNALVFL